MSTTDLQILTKFVHKLENTYADRGGVGCNDLIGDTALSADPLIRELVFSLLLWESSIEHAKTAVEQIRENLIDLNELRVCTPEELSGILGARYPRSLDRSRRLIGILNAIFSKENSLSLVHLREMTKREAIDYFDSIDGLPAYAASRVILLGLGWHAFPIDDRLTKLLSRQGITDATLDINQQTHRMERLVRATDALSHYTLIEHWSQNQRPSRSSSTTNSTTKKKGLSKSGASKSAAKGSS